jgi:hypothetical protein
MMSDMYEKREVYSLPNAVVTIFFISNRSFFASSQLSIRKIACGPGLTSATHFASLLISSAFDVASFNINKG